MQAKTDGHLVEYAELYPILHTCKDGSVVNPAVKEKMVSNFYEICIYANLNTHTHQFLPSKYHMNWSKISNDNTDNVTNFLISLCLGKFLGKFKLDFNEFCYLFHA